MNLHRKRTPLEIKGQVWPDRATIRSVSARGYTLDFADPEDQKKWKNRAIQRVALKPIFSLQDDDTMKKAHLAALSMKRELLKIQRNLVNLRTAKVVPVRTPPGPPAS